MQDLVIIGAGPAGLTAAIYALRAGIEVIVCEAEMYGGQASIIDKLENYPGFDSISGIDFSTKMYQQTEKLGARFIFSKVVKVDLTDKKKILYLSNGEVLESRAVIIANGLKRRVLGCPGEKEYIGKGVSYCATCDGAFFKSKDVVIIGGGNTAIQDALYLSNICNNIKVIVRKSKLRAEKILINNLKKKTNVEIIFNTNIKEIIGKNNVVNKIRIRANIDNNTIERELETSAVFVAVGYEPDCKMFRNQVSMTKTGYFVSNESCETNILGVFVAGDCRTKSLRQISTAISDGAVSGNRAADFIYSSYDAE